MQEQWNQRFRGNPSDLVHQEQTAKKIENKQSQKSKKIAVSKKVHNWAGLQIIKSFLGIPSIPVK